MTIATIESPELIPALCRQFGEATGWPLYFTPADQESHAELESRLRQAAECCWVSEISDGQGRIGFLQLHFPESGRRHSGSASVAELAGLIGQLLSRLSAADRRVQSRTNDVSMLVDIGISARSEENLPQALAHLLEAAAQLTKYYSAALFLLNPTLSRLKLRAVHRLTADQLPPSERDLAECRPDLNALTKGTLALQRQAADEEDEDSLPPSMSCGLCVPIRSSSVPLGTLWVYDRRAHPRTVHEVRILESIAAQIATTLERFVLRRESDTQHRLVTELRAASQNQSITLPEHLSDRPGFEAAARCVSRHELGGDLCELVPLSGQETGIALGDASGNSIPAAMVMTAVRGALRSVTGGNEGQATHPAQAMERMNRALHAIIGPHQFMSLFYGVYDAATCRLTYTNAGHPSPILVRDGQTYPLDSHGLLLGILNDVSYDFSVLECRPGDLLLLYSDGISEAMSHSQELFRLDGIISAVRNCPHGSVQDLLQSIWEKAETHAQGSKTLDDRTLLIVRFREA
jgi:sigma-B regulation protein RsbU (phosphoserine phosphatase)